MIISTPTALQKEKRKSEESGQKFSQKGKSQCSTTPMSSTKMEQVLKTLHQDGEKSYAYNLQWEEYAENQIFIRYVDSYTIEDGKMKTTLDDEVIFEEVDGIWVETPLEGLQLITYEFRDDGICVCTIYDRETKEFLDVYFYEYTPTEAGGILKSKYMSEYVLLEDGTLQDVNYGDILERVSSA